jgi:hypothetical protein
MDKRITFVILGIILVVSGCVQSTKVKEPVTPNATAVATSVMPTIVQNTNTNTVYPIIVVSVQGVYPIVPAGPTIKITLKSNNTDVPITSLSATLSVGKNQRYDFPSINQSHPLMPGQTASQTLIIIGPAGYDSDSTYPLHIEGMLQNGQTFNYTTTVKIYDFGMALKTNLIVNGSGIVANTQPSIESELEIGYNGSPSRLILTQANQYLFRGLVDSIIETDNRTYVEFSGTNDISPPGTFNVNDLQYSANASKIDLNTWRLEITYFDGSVLNYKINGHLQINS